MLHRRTTASSSVTPLPASPFASTANSNKAYTPLRRQSGNLYSTPQSGPRARYPLPSPALSYVGAGPSFTYQAVGGGVYDLTDGGGSTHGLGGLSVIGENVKGAHWAQASRTALDKCKRGFADGIRLDRSWAMVWSDPELRTLVIKSTLINIISLVLLSLSPVFLSPNAHARTRSIGMWYNVLLSWPVFVVCFYVNAIWAPDISRRAQTILHPSYRHQPTHTSSGSNSSTSVTTNPIASLFTSIHRIILISDFTLVSRLIMLIPIFGRPTVLTYMCIINAYYFFEATFASRGWGLDHRISFMQERVVYMLGFGLPATFLTSFATPLVNMAIFALIYPFFVIQALLARPPTPRSSLLPSTPSPDASLPATPTGEGSLSLSNPFFQSTGPSAYKLRLAIPIFFFARYAIEALSWLEEAVMRDRGYGRRGGQGRERLGKRMM